MKKKIRKVVKNVPMRLPVCQTLVFVLAFDYWGAPIWLWASFFTFWGLILIACVIIIFEQEYVDLFEDDGKEKKQ